MKGDKALETGGFVIGDLETEKGRGMCSLYSGSRDVVDQRAVKAGP